MQILGVGPEGSTSRLSVRAEDGRQRIVTVGRTTERWWYAFATNRNLPIVTRVTPRIGYIDLSRLTRDQVDSAFAALADTRAIIFDMRGYPRGTAWSIAPRLVRGDSVPMARGWTRVVASPDPTRVKRVTRLEYVPTNIRLPRTGERP